MANFLKLFVVLLLFTGCNKSKITAPEIELSKSLRFIGEQTLPDSLSFNNTVVGGLSGIDYVNGKYYAISDDKDNARFYEMELSFNEQEFSEITLTNVVKIEHHYKNIDLESLRYDPWSNDFIITNEGAIKNNVDPSIFQITTEGKLVNEFKIPKIFEATNKKGKGPRQNGVFESLSLEKDHLWVGMEIPLKQDGKKPKFTKDRYPVRISKINKKTGALDYQFAYVLDPIAKDSNPPGKFVVSGLAGILQLDKHTFLTLERAYSSGYKDGGNTVKIYQVDISEATDVSTIKSLKKTGYIPAKKTLLFNFEEIRSKLTKGIVDNIEGITFGPDLPNGNKTLVVVSDDNFGKYDVHLNQFIVFEVLK